MRRLAVLAYLLSTVHAFADDKIDFAHDVLPLLKARCAECHTDGKSKGGFSFDTREALLKSKKRDKIIGRVTSADADERMPPKGPALTAKEVATLKAWIDEGLPWQDGFSFAKSVYVAPLKPRRPDIPAAHDGMTNPIDRILDAYFRA